MKRFHALKALGVLTLLSTLLLTDVYARCAGSSSEAPQEVRMCSVTNGCGSYTMLKTMLFSNCMTWCCPDGSAFYSNTCVFAPKTNINNEPYCCQSGSQGGSAFVPEDLNCAPTE